MRVREWINNDLRAREIMQQISNMLNSNEQFRLDDSFSLHISHIRDPERGAGNQRIRKASMALDKLLDSKKSVIKIQNDDELCCARAIVTMKAYCDHGSRIPITSVYDEVDLFKNVKPKHSIATRVYPRDLVEYPNSLPFNVISQLTKSWSFPWITTIKLFSRVLPKTSKSSSSKWVIITMDVIPSQASSEPIIFVYTVKPVTKTTTTGIIPARARSVHPVTRQNVPTFHRTKCRSPLSSMSPPFLRRTMFG